MPDLEWTVEETSPGRWDVHLKGSAGTVHVTRSHKEDAINVALRTYKVLEAIAAQEDA